MQGHHPWAVLERHVNLVQRHNHGASVFTVDTGQYFHHIARRLRVQRCYWLVSKNNLGTLHQRARNGSPLLLTTRQGGRPLGVAVGNADALQRLHGLGPFLRIEDSKQAAPPGHAVQQTNQHIDQHGQAVHKIELLKHKADFRPDTANVVMNAPTLLDAATIDFDQRVGTTISRDQA